MRTRGPQELPPSPGWRSLCPVVLMSTLHTDSETMARTQASFFFSFSSINIGDDHNNQGS